MPICIARRHAGFFLLAGLVCGCAAPQSRQLAQTPPAGLPQNIELADVPFFPQEAYLCGPAALATVLNAAGFPVQPDVLISQVYVPERHGSLQVEMLAAARRSGAAAFELTPELAALLKEIAAGNPVLVLQNLAFNWYPKWHYAVAVGYDIPRSEIILRSGLEKRQVLPMTTFEHTWARSGRWAMLALPPGKLSATADKSVVLAAAVTLEKAENKSTAQQVYAAVLEKSPTDLVALMGMGNTAYAQKDLPQAEIFFRRAIAYHPDSGDAWNNLAQTLADQGRYHEAQYAVKKAVPLGGANLDLYQKTLLEIEHALLKVR
ncbi:MAG: PA2778 family cysteine peptidase [Burkholderiales bacterium]